MARLPRLDLPQVPQHIVQRGNNRQALFFHDADYCVYLDYLREALVKNQCQLYAFVLMTNHVHLLAVGERPGAISGLMQSVGRRYGRYVNATYRRSGTLFEGRFKASLVDSERYLLTCMRYIELNPVRAGMVTDPGDYPWSSYRSHAGQDAMTWLAEPAEYRRLGLTSEARALAYRELCKQRLAACDLEAIRAHLNKDCALGSDKFQEEIEAMAGRRARIVPQGGRRNRKSVRKSNLTPFRTPFRDPFPITPFRPRLGQSSFRHRCAIQEVINHLLSRQRRRFSLCGRLFARFLGISRLLIFSRPLSQHARNPLFPRYGYRKQAKFDQSLYKSALRGSIFAGCVGTEGENQHPVRTTKWTTPLICGEPLMPVTTRFQQHRLPLAIALAMSGAVQAGSFNVGAAGCGLADAIRAANTDTAVGGCPAGSGPDTLRLVKPTFTKTGADDLTLGPSGYPLITSRITLEGDPDGNGVGVIVQRSSAIGTPAFRIFAVAPGGGLTLRRVTVANGNLDLETVYGSGLLNRGGLLTLVNSKVTGNSGGGAAILTDEGGQTTLVGSTVSGNNVSGLDAFSLYARSDAQVSLTRSRVTNNNGSGIFCDIYSRCSINSSTISGNAKNGASGFFYSSFSATNSRITGNKGNGIRNISERDGAVHLVNTEVSDNGGAGILSASKVTLVNSTVSGNGGTGVSVGFIPYCSGTTLSNTTVSGNKGGGIGANDADCVTLQNTILAGNQGTDCIMSVAPDSPSIANNIIQDGSCNAAARGALTGDPKLAPLLDNGGLTLTHGLRFGLSPAINSGSNATCGPTDQRDAKRPQNTTCDIGSFEIITAPKPTVAAADAFLTASVQAGTLVGTGAGTMPGYRVSAARQQLRVAGDLVSQGKTTDACAQLARTLTRIDTDGASPDSNDYLTGSSAPGMVNQVNAIRTNLACN